MIRDFSYGKQINSKPIKANLSLVEVLDHLSEIGIAIKVRKGELLIDGKESLSAELCNYISQHKSEIIQYISSNSEYFTLDLSIQCRPKKVFDFTELQSAYLVGEKLYHELRTPAFVAHSYEVKDLDVSRFKDALIELLQHHEMLRSAVVSDSKQKIKPLDESWDITVVDVSKISDDELQSYVDKYQAPGSDFIPNLESGTNIGCTVLKARKTYFVFLYFRLFVLDARSLGIIYRDLALYYKTREQNSIERKHIRVARRH